MLKVALVSPGFLPVPAVNGGGVEKLIDILINDNEIKNKLKIDIYSIYDEKIKDIKLKNSKLYSFKISFIKKVYAKLINFLCKKLNIHRMYSSYYAKTAKKINNIADYDYIIIENNMYLYKKIYKKYKGNARFIFHLHNDIDNFDKPIKLCKFINETAYKILTVSQFLKNRFVKFTQSTTTEVLYNCVDIEEFSKIEISKEKLYKKYNVSESDIKFLFCGRFHKEKGLLELIEAFNEVAKKYDNIKLLIVGSSSRKEFGAITIQSEYDKLIYKRIHENNNIVECGYISKEELSSYYNLSDVVVVPSNCNEAFGLVTVEAMALSKPLIVSDGGALPEVVSGEFVYIANRNKLICNLRKGLEYYINNKKNIESLGKQAKEYLLYKGQYKEKYYYDNFMEALK